MGTDFSRVEGTGANRVLIVAEASGEMEARDGLPLRPYAPAGSLLERTFRRMGFDRLQFSLTNVLRCRPRNNWLEGAPWEYSAINHCSPNLTQAISDRRPRCIVSLGGTALRELTGMAGEARGIGHLAGYVLPGPDDIPVIANFHPAFLRRGKASLQGLFARILNRAVNIASGKDTSWLWNLSLEDGHAAKSLSYQTHPSSDAIAEFRDYILARPQLVVSYDLETSESASLDEDAREGFADTQIRLVQFSVEGLGSIAIPYTYDTRGAIQSILHSPNVKCGHNVWLFDNKVLRAAGERDGIDLSPKGIIHDTLQMFHHWQPDLPAHLQFCAQFVQFPFPWKHLAGSDIEFYGCADVHSDLLLYHFLETALKKDGLYGDATLGYTGQVVSVRPILADMEDRGLPIDDPARLALDAEFDAAQSVLGEELARLAPDACKRVHPKEGYKGVPPEVKKWEDAAGVVVTEHKFTEASKDGEGESYRYALREFAVADIDAVTGDPVAIATTRWCRVYDFNPNSSQQLLAYMKARKHKPPKGKQEDRDGNPKDTTAKKELQRLAHRTGDTFYLKVIEYRELSKMRGTYIEGFKPHADGRVHTTFTFDTGTGQLTSRNPNVQNFPKHGRLAEAVRGMVRAPEGQVIVEADFKSYHVLTTGFEAEDASYMRMARLDMHSFVAGCFTGDWKPYIIEESDDALMERFQWFKRDSKRKRIRDKQAKPSILGVGFGMGYRRLYQENLEHFDGERTAKKFLDLLRHLFPKVFVWQDRIRQLAHAQQYLRSKFGHMRRFYEVFTWRNGAWAPGDQAEEAVAFLPANHAFGNIRECMKEQRRLGIDERFGLINNIHDSFMYVFPRSLLDEFLATVPPVLTAPSKVLIHPTLAPGGLTVDVEIVAGADWRKASMRDVTPTLHFASAPPADPPARLLAPPIVS